MTDTFNYDSKIRIFILLALFKYDKMSSQHPGITINAANPKLILGLRPTVK